MNKLSIHELAPILNAISVRTGIKPEVTHWRSSHTLTAQLSARLRAGEIAQILEQIEGDSVLFNELVDELTVRETYFFRDPGQFDLIANQILPEIDSRRGFGHIIRCWSAGCSSGEEAYSLAILLFKHGFANRSQVIGTDISLEALARARAGRYGKWSLRGEGAVFTEPYLRDEGRSKVVHDTIHRQVSFFRLNLANNTYLLPSAQSSDFDIILCRNVLIYFDEHTIRGVARRLFDSLAVGGWLLTAAADPILSEYAPFEVIVSKVGVLYRRPLPAVNEPVKLQVEIPDQYAVRIPPLSAEVDNCSFADKLALARDAFQARDYVTAARLTREHKIQSEACILHIRALANLGNRQATIIAEEAIEHHPLCSELYYLLAHLRLLDGDQIEAIALLRKAIYLSPSLAVAHFMLGSLLKHSGDPAGAQRHLRNAMVLAGARPSDEVLAMSDGEPAGLLVNAARKLLSGLAGDKTK